MTSNQAGRMLLDVALEACRQDEDSGGYALVCTNAVELGLFGPDDVVRRAAASGSLIRSSEDLARTGGNLRTLVMAHMSSDGTTRRCWIIDGWSLIRSYGAGVDLRGVDLRGADLRGARLGGGNLGGADLRGADLEKADLADARLVATDLAGATLFSASLRGADLTEAELRRADLRHADLRRATCVRTALRGADLWGAYLWDVDLSSAFTEGTEMDRADQLNTKVS
jgi:uncharacterized protein YjbI with pentapeptide repeats